MEDHREFARASHGDLNAIEAIYTRWKQPLYAYIARMLGDDHEAEDLLAETFTLFVQTLHRYRDDSDPSRILFTIARREVWRFRRKHHWRVLHPDPGALEQDALPAWEFQRDNPARHAAAREEHERLLAAVQRLTPRLRSVFILVDLLGKSHQEAAAIERTTSSSIRRAAARARARLLKDLGPRLGRAPSDPSTEGGAP